ncbi:MAG: hypothetical protein C0506_04545 [Anaerolinea sp.]|nr:hypothetical protein [Anaerolinea sp.]
MGRLRPLTGREVCEILEAHGFRVDRQRGSHVIMKRSLPPPSRTVPVPLHREVPAGTLRSIIRQSGLASELFEFPA